MPFNLLLGVLLENKEAIKLVRSKVGDHDHVFDILQKVKLYEDQVEGNDLFIEIFRSYYESHQCVFGVLKNM